MKRIIAAITLVIAMAATANAGVLAYIENEAGGTIRFTDRECLLAEGKDRKVWHGAYATSGNGSIAEACWVWDDDTKEMLTVYDNNDVRRYPIAAATFTDYFYKLKSKYKDKQQADNKPSKKKGKTL